MIRTEILQEKVGLYRQRCFFDCHKPTFCGLGRALGISRMTVSNVARGRFNGKEYTDKPSATRCIDNADFKVIQGLFESAENSSI